MTDHPLTPDKTKLLSAEGTKLLSAENTKVVISITSLLTLFLCGWAVSRMHSDITNSIERLGEIGDIRWGELDKKLEGLNDRVSTLIGDHDEFVRRSELRLALRQLEALNLELVRDGDERGLRIPPQD